MERVMLIRYGEIHLKGRNRPFFERTLLDNIRKALVDFEGVKVIKAQGRFFVENYSNERLIIDALTKVFGIVSISPAVKIEKDLERIYETAEVLMKDILTEENKDNITFKVESRRSDKKFPLNSMELSQQAGARLLSRFPQLKVDVHNPEVTVNIEIREYAYLYNRIIPGSGGMPVGTNGKATLLLSGGIDSPVAGYMISKRGVEISAVHYHSFPYTSDRAKEKVIDLAKELTKYCGSIKLYVVPFTRIQQELFEKCPDSQLTVLMRRFMMAIAERIAINDGSKALITGESIGQVASQTIDSLAVTDDAVSMPVFRPLIGLDKIEIMNIAKQIGTYETSILPYEDCCTIFLPKNPVTKPKLEKIRQSEIRLDVEELIADAVEQVEVIQL